MNDIERDLEDQLKVAGQRLSPRPGDLDEVLAAASRGSTGGRLRLGAVGAGVVAAAAAAAVLVGGRLADDAATISGERPAAVADQPDGGQAGGAGDAGEAGQTTEADETLSMESCERPNDRGFVVFLNPTLNQDDVDALVVEIESRGEALGLTGARAFSRSDALDEFREMFEDDPDLVRNVTPGLLPPSVRFDTPSFETATLAHQQVSDVEGVLEVSLGQPIDPCRSWPLAMSGGDAVIALDPALSPGVAAEAADQVTAALAEAEIDPPIRVEPDEALAQFLTLLDDEAAEIVRTSEIELPLTLRTPGRRMAESDPLKDELEQIPGVVWVVSAPPAAG